MATTLSTAGFFQAVVLRNTSWSRDISNDIISASMSMDTAQVAEMSISVDDPGLKVFRDSNIPLDAPLDYRDLKLSVASFETGEGGGEGGFTLRARPRVVRTLKNRKGAHIMYNVSPSTFVQSETAAAGGTSVVQPSAVRSQVARDVQIVGQQGNSDTSTWSTFSRLAGELGFVCFEVGGTIYFGKPSWFVQTQPKVYVFWNGTGVNEKYNAEEMPVCNRSLDNNGRATVDVKVPIERSGEFRPGMALVLRGVPRFEETFFITKVDFPLAGSGSVSVTAETPFDPAPQTMGV